MDEEFFSEAPFHDFQPAADYKPETNWCEKITIDTQKSIANLSDDSAPPPQIPESSLPKPTTFNKELGAVKKKQKQF